jgi:hypothetical protein
VKPIKKSATSFWTPSMRRLPEEEMFRVIGRATYFDSLTD